MTRVILLFCCLIIGGSCFSFSSLFSSDKDKTPTPEPSSFSFFQNDSPSFFSSQNKSLFGPSIFQRNQQLTPQNQTNDSKGTSQTPQPQLKTVRIDTNQDTQSAKNAFELGDIRQMMESMRAANRLDPLLIEEKQESDVFGFGPSQSLKMYTSPYSLQEIKAWVQYTTLKLSFISAIRLGQSGKAARILADLWLHGVDHGYIDDVMLYMRDVFRDGEYAQDIADAFAQSWIIAISDDYYRARQALAQAIVVSSSMDEDDNATAVALSVSVAIVYEEDCLAIAVAFAAAYAQSDDREAIAKTETITSTIVQTLGRGQAVASAQAAAQAVNGGEGAKDIVGATVCGEDITPPTDTTDTQKPPNGEGTKRAPQASPPVQTDQDTNKRKLNSPELVVDKEKMAVAEIDSIQASPDLVPETQQSPSTENNSPAENTNTPPEPAPKNNTPTLSFGNFSTMANDIFRFFAGKKQSEPEAEDSSSLENRGRLLKQEERIVDTESIEGCVRVKNFKGAIEHAEQAIKGDQVAAYALADTAAAAICTETDG